MRSVTTALDFVLGAVVEILAAALVAAEIIILFSGVVARYVLNHPLIWSDELASILFLWLAMTGAAIVANGNVTAGGAMEGAPAGMNTNVTRGVPAAGTAPVLGTGATGTRE